MLVTLKRILEFDPCDGGWELLCYGLGIDPGLDTDSRVYNRSVSILDILEFNNLDDAIWAICVVKGAEEIRDELGKFIIEAYYRIWRQKQSKENREAARYLIKRYGRYGDETTDFYEDKLSIETRGGSPFLYAQDDDRFQTFAVFDSAINQLRFYPWTTVSRFRRKIEKKVRELCS